MLLAGDAGRGVKVKGEAAGFGGKPGPELELCRGRDGIEDGGGGTEVAVGVARGVDAVELALAVDIGAGVCLPVVAGAW